MDTASRIAFAFTFAVQKSGAESKVNTNESTTIIVDGVGKLLKEKG